MKRQLLFLFLFLLAFLGRAQDGSNDLSFNGDKINLGMDQTIRYHQLSRSSADGKIIIGGLFTFITVTNIGRILPG
jgi:hypothetical protein